MQGYGLQGGCGSSFGLPDGVRIDTDPGLTNLPADLYVDNVNGSDVLGDGSAAKPWQTLAFAMMKLPILADYARTIHLIASPTNYEFPSRTLMGFNLCTIEGALANDGQGTLTSTAGTGGTEASGISAVVAGAGWTPDEHVGKSIKWSSGGLNNTYGVVYANTSDTLSVSTDRTNAFVAPSSGDTFELLEHAVTIAWPEENTSNEQSVYVDRSLFFRDIKFLITSAAVGNRALQCSAVGRTDFRRCFFDSTIGTVLVTRGTSARFRTSYFTCRGDSFAERGIASISNNADGRFMQGTVIDGTFATSVNPAGSGIKARSNSSIEWQGEMVVRELGTLGINIEGNGTTQTAENTSPSNFNVVRFVNCQRGLRFNPEEEDGGGNYYVVDMHGTITGNYVVEAQNDSIVTLQGGTASSAAGVLSVSADGGVSNIAQSDDGTIIRGGSPAYVPPVSTGNTIWVDAVFGNDATALTDRQDKPFVTLGAALAVVSSGDVIMLRPGQYAEEGLTLPQGVSIEGQGGWQVTEVGLHAAASDIMTVSDQSSIEGVSFLVPSTAGLAGVRYVGVTDPTFSIYNCNFYGDRGAGAGAGDGMVKQGAGKIIGAEIRGDRAGMNSLLRVSSGVLALESIHVPPDPFGGSIGAVALCEATGRFQLVDINAGNPNVTDVVRMDGGTAIIFGINTFNVQNSVHITADGIKLEILGGKMEQSVSGFAVLVDPLLTGANSIVRITANHQPIYSYPPVVAANADFGLAFFQEGDDLRYSEQRSFGSDLALGFPERGSALYGGQGSPYGRGLYALTTDNTASPTSDGGNFVDITAEAQSLTSSTFTFQGTGAGHSILWCSQRLDVASVQLKHWGLRLIQTTAGSGGTYVFEVSAAGTNWTTMGVMAYSEDEEYRYSNDVFIRPDSVEIIHWGLDDNSAWTNRTINGQAGYWARVRIATTVTTAPVFETLWLAASYFETNDRGQRTATGLARWRDTLVGVGNIWSEGGSIANSTSAVGSGGGLTGWTHEIDNSSMNVANEALYFQFTLPRGIDTSYPLSLKFYYQYAQTGTNDFSVSMVPMEVAGNEIADPAGGIVPIPRTLADTDEKTANPGVGYTLTCGGSSTTKIQATEFGPFPIEGFYEDDMVALRVQMVNGNPDTIAWGISIEGVFWSDGRGLL
jgi:hypothetical protein